MNSRAPAPAGFRRPGDGRARGGKRRARPREIALLGTLLALVGGVCGAPAQQEGLTARWQSFLDREPAHVGDRPYPYRECFRQAAAAQDLPESLLLAVARGESNFDPWAKSSAGAYGLMQIRWPDTAKHLGIHRLASLLDPCTNVKAGSRYLKELLEVYQGDLHRALAAYNYGPSRVPQAPDAIPAGADRYSAYIWHHLAHIRGGYDTGGEPDAQGAAGTSHLAVIRFRREYRARAFAAWLRPKLEGIPVESRPRDNGGFDVVLVFGNRSELERGKALLSALGMVP